MKKSVLHVANRHVFVVGRPMKRAKCDASAYGWRPGRRV